MACYNGDMNESAKKQRLNETVHNLEHNGFCVHSAADAAEANATFFHSVLPALAPKSVSYGDSLTLHACGVLERLKAQSDIEMLAPFVEDHGFEEKFEERRKSLCVDLFLTGTNAITRDGKLINLDMWGNRINGINFGPRHVVLFVGTNKIVDDLQAGMEKIRHVIAPRNAARFERYPTPCQKTGVCVDCSSPNRICNAWSILDKCWPKERIHIILIDEPLGIG